MRANVLFRALDENIHITDMCAHCIPCTRARARDLQPYNSQNYPICALRASLRGFPEIIPPTPLFRLPSFSEVCLVVKMLLFSRLTSSTATNKFRVSNGINTKSAECALYSAHKTDLPGVNGQKRSRSVCIPGEIVSSRNNKSRQRYIQRASARGLFGAKARSFSLDV